MSNGSAQRRRGRRAMNPPGADNADFGSPASGPAPRLYQRAFTILAGQIASGSIAPGAWLGEAAVAAQFDISRAPARRALAELEATGLVAKASGRGYLVRADAQNRGTRVDAPATGEDMRLIAASSWERIYREVENEIVARIAFSSWRVNEAELARSYAVSRTVARDVVARLQQRGIVRKDERSRWYAPALGPEHVGELYELRWLLEPAAMVKAAPNLPAGFLAAMRRHLEEAIAHSREIEGPSLDRLEEEMHVELLGHCGNRTLMQAIVMPQSLLIAHRFLYRWTPRLFDTEPFLPEHLAIVKHLESRQTKKAARELEQHLRVSGERALARIDVIRHAIRPSPLPYIEELGEG